MCSFNSLATREAGYCTVVLDTTWLAVTLVCRSSTVERTLARMQAKLGKGGGGPEVGRLQALGMGGSFRGLFGRTFLFPLFFFAFCLLFLPRIATIFGIPLQNSFPNRDNTLYPLYLLSTLGPDWVHRMQSRTQRLIFLCQPCHLIYNRAYLDLVCVRACASEQQQQQPSPPQQP
ncbi:hypothetical protein F5X99DRAFT_199524 [Biscogniauxia marginata]|nr:hypothetical protein F5X99DRAFT_199524 [Biscogniauxia marginata]